MFFLNTLIVFRYCLFLQEHLEQLVRDNEQLKAEVKELLNSSALMTSPRDQGNLSVTDMFALSALFSFGERFPAI